MICQSFPIYASKSKIIAWLQADRLAIYKLNSTIWYALSPSKNKQVYSTSNIAIAPMPDLIATAIKFGL